MLIQCGKCGKMYDYDKYSGICPKCARYNRLDSREDMEQNMHDRYDTGSHPHQHDWYQEPQNTYKHSPKSYAHEEEKRETGWKSADRSDNSKIRKHMGVKIFVIVICMIVGILAVTAVLFSHVQDIFNDGWEIGDQNYEQTEEVIDPEYQNRIYVDYACLLYTSDAADD